MDQPGRTTHFGNRDVPVGDKQTLVNEVFHSVAARYDLMNDLMSGGVHRVWKALMINALDPPRADTPFALLDVAGGTGDIAFRAAREAGHGFRATVCDINTDMLEVGRARALKTHLDDRVSFVEGNAEALAFPDRSTPTRLRSASAMCRESTSRSRRPFACSGMAAVSCAWNFPLRSTCPGSTGSTSCSRSG